ncbi:chlorohydrolase [Streptococcus pneumoniae]|nr:chlorohydrolase [Streptococcus pneumoniae]
MKIKEQTRKPGCSKHCFEVADELTRFEGIFEEYKILTF